MTTSGTTFDPRAEYRARIHRVQDYIEAHLGGRLTLEELAGVAAFSPFHFHRLYRALTGESLYQYILRLRLERAASWLGAAPGTPVTEIALDCGFASSAAFARAFRQRYGMTASEWRRAGSKNRETLRKKWEDSGEGGGEDGDMSSSCVPDATPRMAAQSVRVENVASIPVAYVRHVGPYAGDQALFLRLFRQVSTWAGARGLIGPKTMWMAVYHDNPEITAAEQLRVSVCLSVPEGTKGSGEVNTMEIAAGAYAKALFELDKTQFGAAWAWVCGEWLPSSGYAPDDRLCLENYLNDPEQHPEKKMVVEIWIPVRPL